MLVKQPRPLLQCGHTRHTPSPGRVVVVGAQKDGVETVNSIHAHRGQANPTRVALATSVVTFSST